MAVASVIAILMLQGPQALAKGSSVTASGGMTEAGTTSQLEPYALPSCASVTYTGPDGYISVQTSPSKVVAWGITMTPPSKSIGAWNVSTYLNDRKTSSGFNRTTTGPYIPHGSIQARSGEVFRVEATVAATDGRTYHNVPNACQVP